MKKRAPKSRALDHARLNAVGGGGWFSDWIPNSWSWPVDLPGQLPNSWQDVADPTPAQGFNSPSPGGGGGFGGWGGFGPTTPFF